MPTNRTRRKRLRNCSELTQDQEMHLLHGFALDGCLPDYGHPRNMVNFPFRDDDDRRECWERNRDLLMSQFSEPFRRPDAWWSYDAPEPRRRTPAVYAFGPKGWTHYEPGTEGLFKPRDTEIIEGELDFLIRLDLLNDAERKLLEVESNDAQKEESGTETEAAPLPEMR